MLLDAATFSCIKEALWRLGAVGPDGLDEDALLASKSAKRVSSSSSRGGCVEGDGCLPRIMSAGSLRWVWGLKVLLFEGRCGGIINIIWA